MARSTAIIYLFLYLLFRLNNNSSHRICYGNIRIFHKTKITHKTFLKPFFHFSPTSHPHFNPKISDHSTISRIFLWMFQMQKNDCIQWEIFKKYLLWFSPWISTLFAFETFTKISWKWWWWWPIFRLKFGWEIGEKWNGFINVVYA